jgi:aminopeptidase N
VMLAIKWFGLWYGRYPHQTLTIVDPAHGGDGSGGMEYPTFITAGTSPRFNGWPFDGVRLPEEVIVHEFGHQYFQGMLASNEFEEAWLDEGINSYATGRVMERGYGRDATMISFLGWQAGERDYLRSAIAPNIKFTAINQPAWMYPDDWSYSINSYVRPELMLRTVEHLTGTQAMARVMRTYAERWRYKHPSTLDFYAVANEISGRASWPCPPRVWSMVRKATGS